MTKQKLLELAVEITKEYARGGGSAPTSILSSLYEELKKINKDLSTE